VHCVLYLKVTADDELLFDIWQSSEFLVSSLAASVLLLNSMLHSSMTSRGLSIFLAFLLLILFCFVRLADPDSAVLQATSLVV
jgi:hypothetical protein